MTTLAQQLETARLSKECKIDLMTVAEQIELENYRLPKRGLTVSDKALPSAVKMTTAAHEMKSVHRADPDAKQRFLHEKSFQAEVRMRTALASQKSATSYTKSYKATYHDAPFDKDPFRNSRDRAELSGRDECFVHRYAEALTKSSIERVPKTDVASLAGQDSYRKAFHSYLGRDPTQKEMEEAGRVHFGFDELGNVGIVQKPHSCFPHSHITICNRRPVQCPSQVYKPEAPGVRAARDRFPGPVPIWSSTKNLSAMVASDMHAPGHQNTMSIKKAAVNTIVGSK